MNQYEKDIDAALWREDQWRGPEQAAFADGAAYARKEVLRRLRSLVPKMDDLSSELLLDAMKELESS